MSTNKLQKITDAFSAYVKGGTTAEQLEAAIHKANQPVHPTPWKKKQWDSRNYTSPFAPKRLNAYTSYERWGVQDANDGWVATVKDEETADLLVNLANGPDGV